MRNKRASQLTAASDVLQAILENSKSPLGNQFQRWKLWRKWKEIVGETLASRTEPVGYERGTLYVWVRNAVWMQEMYYFSKPIADRVNKFLGQDWVKRVRMTMDRRQVPGLTDEQGQLLDAQLDSTSKKNE